MAHAWYKGVPLLLFWTYEYDNHTICVQIATQARSQSAVVYQTHSVSHLVVDIGSMLNQQLDYTAVTPVRGNGERRVTICLW